MMDLPFNYARVLYDEKISSKDLKKMRELLTGAPELSDALDNCFPNPSRALSK